MGLDDIEHDIMGGWGRRLGLGTTALMGADAPGESVRKSTSQPQEPPTHSDSVTPEPALLRPKVFGEQLDMSVFMNLHGDDLGLPPLRKSALPGGRRPVTEDSLNSLKARSNGMERHPSGEPYKQMELVHTGQRPLTVIGIAHPNGHTFEAFDPASGHKFAGSFAVIDRVQRDGSGKVFSSEKVLVDPQELKLKGGSSLFLPKGVKKSTTSPTGYKLASNNMPCDKHGRPVQAGVQVGGASTPSASRSSAERYNPTQHEIGSMAQSHATAKRSQRPQTAYSNAIRATMLLQHAASHGDLQARLYQRFGGAAQPSSPEAVLEYVISRLDRQIPDQVRLADFLSEKRQRYLGGEQVALPAYYHCFKENAFESIFGSDEPQIKVFTPRTGTGGAGAWLSTKPEVSAYGPYAVVFNRNTDFLYSTRSTEQGLVPPRLVGGQYHIGIQEPVNLRAVGAASSADHPLSMVGVPANELYDMGPFSSLNPQLRFTNARGKPDIAVFSTETIQAFAIAMAEVEPPKVPLIWLNA